MEVTAVRKEDDLYKNLVGWIISESLRDIYKGNFIIDGIAYDVDYTGEEIAPDNAHRITHKKLWDKIKSKYGDDKNYKFYPRFRVNVYEGVLYMNINSRINTPRIVNALINMSNGKKLELEIEHNDESQGDHYDFELK